jgi:hypothetical protein
MAITQEIFEAFLKCHTKAPLIGHDVAIEQSAIDPPLKELDDTYRHSRLEYPGLRASFSPL